MNRKLALALFVVIALALGAGAVLTPTPAAAKSCPKRSHLVVCPTYSFCCPDNALCVCL